MQAQASAVAGLAGAGSFSIASQAALQGFSFSKSVAGMHGADGFGGRNHAMAMFGYDAGSGVARTTGVSGVLALSDVARGAAFGAGGDKARAQFSAADAFNIATNALTKDKTLADRISPDQIKKLAGMEASAMEAKHKFGSESGEFLKAANDLQKQYAQAGIENQFSSAIGRMVGEENVGKVEGMLRSGQTFRDTAATEAENRGRMAPATQRLMDMMGGGYTAAKMGGQFNNQNVAEIVRSGNAGEMIAWAREGRATGDYEARRDMVVDALTSYFGTMMQEKGAMATVDTTTADGKAQVNFGFQVPDKVAKTLGLSGGFQLGGGGSEQHAGRDSYETSTNMMRGGLLNAIDDATEKGLNFDSAVENNFATAMEDTANFLTSYNKNASHAGKDAIDSIANDGTKAMDAVDRINREQMGR